MAVYGLRMKPISRSEGRSATAAAAYRAGCEIDDRRTGERFDFTQKRGVLHSEIVLPENAPPWAGDRQEFWNRVEAADKRADSVTAREVQLDLPHELTADQRKALALDYARYMTDRYGLAVDVNIHAPDRRGDERNHHAHLLVATRPFDPESRTGFGNKDRSLDPIAAKRGGKDAEAEHLRTVWEEQTNAALERADVRGQDGEPVRVTRLSFERQGIEQEPTVKEGPAATGLKRRGEGSERAQANAEVRERNAVRGAALRRVAVMEQELAILRPRQAQYLTGTQAREALTSAPPRPVTWEEHLEQKIREGPPRDRTPEQSRDLEL
eukprot:gnl/Spiro4/3803_TR1878_c0_g1_i1.p1 gnl/Spiro4/3803_TR1878_c0_g1~~gnl/Spiro4/3803_TR1878_c0_g1_i1.p1  ORF type:complete len:325 (+),score=26.33 gnl/Spiro4/3803_TR1878_c0_g1_i1:109-1083(+)